MRFLIYSYSSIAFVIGYFFLNINISYDFGDGIMHFLFAKYSWSYHEFFLDHWGKPVFTILASPFAQLGINGMHVFQIILLYVVCHATILIAKKWELRFLFLIPFFVAFAPVYFINTFSGLTEPLFTAISIVAITALIYRRLYFSFILISFLPLVRSEGFILLSLWGVFALLENEWKKIPLLLVGTILFSLLGLIFVYHDFFWIFTRNPYVTSDKYGSGNFSFYFDKGLFLFGRLQWILALIGLVFFIFHFKKIFQINIKLKSAHINWVIVFPIMFGLAFFLLHSFLWALGLMKVLGQDRFMLCIVPEIVLISFYAINQLVKIIDAKYKSISVYLPFIITIYFCAEVYINHAHKLLSQNEKDALIVNASQWVLANKKSSSKIYYSAPVIAVIVNHNPFTQINGGFFEYKDNLAMNKGDLIIWDAQFSGFEQGVDIDALVKNKSVKVLKTFEPKTPVNVFDSPFNVIILEKL